jgi:hypothetical protein
MAVLLEMEIPASPEQYDQVNEILDPTGNPPEGLIAHSAREDGGKMSIVDIWESQQAFGAFAESRLGPAVSKVMGGDGPSAPEPKFTELYNAFSV